MTKKEDLHILKHWVNEHGAHGEPDFRFKLVKGYKDGESVRVYMGEYPQPQQKSAPTRDFEDLVARITDTSMVPCKPSIHIWKIQAWQHLDLLDPNYFEFFFMAP